MQEEEDDLLRRKTSKHEPLLPYHEYVGKHTLFLIFYSGAWPFHYLLSRRLTKYEKMPFSLTVPLGVPSFVSRSWWSNRWDKIDRVNLFPTWASSFLASSGHFWWTVNIKRKLCNCQRWWCCANSSKCRLSCPIGALRLAGLESRNSFALALRSHFHFPCRTHRAPVSLVSFWRTTIFSQVYPSKGVEWAPKWPPPPPLPSSLLLVDSGKTVIGSQWKCCWWSWLHHQH